MIKKFLDKIYNKVIGVPLICPTCEKFLQSRDIGYGRIFYECPTVNDEYRNQSPANHNFNLVYDVTTNSIVSYEIDLMNTEKRYKLISTNENKKHFAGDLIFFHTPKRTILYRKVMPERIDNKYHTPIVLEDVFLPYENGFKNNVDKILKLSAFL